MPERAASTRTAADAGNGAFGRSVEHAATQGVSGDVVGLLRQIANLQEQAAEIARKLPEIVGDQLAAPARVEAECPPVEPPPLLTANDLARRLSVSPASIRKWRREGELPAAVDLGGVLRWRPEVVEAWLAEREEAGR